jgi:hypothetical protein
MYAISISVLGDEEFCRGRIRVRAVVRVDGVSGLGPFGNRNQRTVDRAGNLRSIAGVGITSASRHFDIHQIMLFTLAAVVLASASGGFIVLERRGATYSLRTQEPSGHRGS